MSRSPEILFANYALPPPILLSASMDRVGEYAVSVGTHKLRIAPLKVPHVRQLRKGHDYPFISELYQSFRGENSWLDVFAWAFNQEIPTHQRPAKIAIAAKSKLMLPHISRSVIDLEYLAHAIPNVQDFMLQWETVRDQPLRSTNTTRRVQLTTEVADIKSDDTDQQKSAKIRRLPELIQSRGLQSTSFHLNSSLLLVLNSDGKINQDNIATIAQITDEVDFSPDRNDLIDATQGSLAKWLDRNESIERQVIEALRQSGCNIRRVVFAVTPSAIYTLNNSRNREHLKGKQREIIDSLREI
jgi:hypothetical protein